MHSLSRSILYGVLFSSAAFPILMAPVRADQIRTRDGTGTRRIEPAAYAETLGTIEKERKILSRRYDEARSDPARDFVLGQAHEVIERSVVSKILPFWYGTPWAFEGTTNVPGVGEIACGYLVTTVLRDAGFEVERERLAQQPSENIIRSLIGPANVRRFSDVPVERFIASIEQWGRGLYIVGLDIHVGFIVNDRTGVHFIHSSYMPPLRVVREKASESSILRASHYRVLGKLLNDKDLALKWLRKTHIPIRMR